MHAGGLIVSSLYTTLDLAGGVCTTFNDACVDYSVLGGFRSRSRQPVDADTPFPINFRYKMYASPTRTTQRCVDIVAPSAPSPGNRAWQYPE